MYDYFAAKYFEKQQTKRPSEKLRRANELWEMGMNLRMVNTETDLFTRVPENLSMINVLDSFYVDGKPYRLDRFEFYDNVVVKDEHGNESFHNIYGSRGDDFLMRATLKHERTEQKENKEQVEEPGL